MILATLKSKAWQIVSGILAGIVLVLWVQLHGLPIIGGGVLSELRIAQTTITNIRNAQKDATAAQIAVNAETAYKSAKIAEVNNAQAPEYYDRVKRAAADSVRPAPRCAAIAPDLPATDSPAKVDDGDASASGMVSVAQDDWAKVTDAAGQAVMCVTAGRALIDAGVAVEGVE